MEGSTIRPNIRIEIHNNLVEPMEVEEAEEEGEISDTNEGPIEAEQPEVVKNQSGKQRVCYKNPWLLNASKIFNLFIIGLAKCKWWFHYRYKHFR